MNKSMSLLLIVAALVLGCIAWLVSPTDASKALPHIGLIAVADLKKKRKEIVDKMRPLGEQSTLSAEEQTQFNALEKEANDLAAQIKRIESVGKHDADLAARDGGARPNPEGGTGSDARVENPGFKSMAEMIFVARTQPGDSRIRALQEMKTGTSGGIAVPDEFLNTFLQVTPSAAIVRPRATLLPQGMAPDAEVGMPALDQGSGKNMYGGVEVAWSNSEDTDVSDTGASIREVTLAPKEVSASVKVTNKLIRNWQGAGATIEGLLRGATLAAEDVAFLRGNGVGRPMGAQVGSCVKAVNRTEANKVQYIDLCNMEDEHHDEGNSIFVVSKRAVRQLRIMEDNAGQLIWADPKGGQPATLMGRPVAISYRSPALGAKGDVFLADFKYYLIRDGVGLSVFVSEHRYAEKNQTLIKVIKSVDGQAWLKDPLAQEDGSTYSPFVVLDVPA